MSTAITTAGQLGAEIERVLVEGDLARLTPDQRVTYYNRTCESLRLNPLTRPFAYLSLNGKLILYARKDCTDQLRSIHRISLQIVDNKLVDGLYIVTCRATMPDGREDQDVGAVPMGNLQGEARANAVMKAHTKAKRRTTLSIIGLSGLLDETEIDSVAGARRVEVTPDGEILGPPANSNENMFDTFMKALVEAKTEDELVALADEIKRKKFSDVEKMALSSTYQKRKKTIHKAAQPTQPELPDESA